MALILSLETSTPVCSVALSKDGEIVDSRVSFEDRSHATLLTVFVEELLHQNNLSMSDISAVAISQGPGSYTGLRIGVSVAKGLCYGSDIPLIALDTLKAMAQMAKDKVSESDVLFCPMIDARRMEVYSELFDSKLNAKREIIAEVIDENTYTSLLDQNKIVFHGNGAEKCTEIIIHENAVFIDGLYPSAEYMIGMAHEAFDAKDFKDVAYFEPFYLKDFVATTPKKKLF